MEHEVAGQVERITFSNPETGFTVAKILQNKNLICIVGKMPPLNPGERVRCCGQWSVSPTHGKQFVVNEVRVEAPAGVAGIQKYLESGMVHGIGRVYASKIVDHFGEQTLEVLDSEPQRLREVQGIGKKRAAQLMKAWQEQRSIRDVMILLQSFGISPAYAQKIYRRYGDEAAARVRANPYCLAQDVVGIGFRKADAIARDLGIEADSDRRLEAGIEYVLSELAGQGHTRFPTEEFGVKTAELLEVVPQVILDLLPSLSNVVVRDGYVWQRRLLLSEEGIARELRRIQAGPCGLRAVDTGRALDWVQDKLHMRLADHQGAAVRQALEGKALIITGGPGTGKSTITNAILCILSRLTHKILLAAPTGRAAKRMSEITRREAKTLHSLLEVDFTVGGFRRGAERPLDCDLLVVDEASMIDTSLMYSLLRAVPSHARLILVGDVNQLPSVGPGNVLGDLIASGRVATAPLTKIFRQAAGSRIITNAHRIHAGQMPELRTESGSDFFFVEEEEPETVQAAIVGLVSQRLPKHFGLDPIEAVQVLTPMKRGPIGTEKLNTLLQAKLNCQRHGVEFLGQQFLLGDKVMQVRNNYDREVFNGDVGRIVQVSEQEIVISFDGRKVIYSVRDLDEIQLAYAVTVHKYQGSECPCVVMPVHTSHFVMLQRNLLYTGVTRARKLVVLVGNKRAVATAVHNNEVEARYTGLRETLCK